MAESGYNISQVMQRRERLYEVLSPLLHCTLDGGHHSRLVSAFAKILPDRVPEVVIFETLRVLIGRELYDADARLLAWRVAGGVNFMARGEAVGVYVQRTDEWCPWQVTRCDPGRDRDERFGWWVSGIYLAGRPSGLSSTAFWTKPMMVAMSRRAGFTKRTGRFPLLDGQQVTSLRFNVLVSAERTVDNPKFSKVDCRGSSLDYNREILALRYRQPSMAAGCPNGYSHHCHICPIGYRPFDLNGLHYQGCQAACHPDTYVLQLCNRCRVEKFFDLARSTTACVDCLNELAAAPRKH